MLKTQVLRKTQAGGEIPDWDSPERAISAEFEGPVRVVSVVNVRSQSSESSSDQGPEQYIPQRGIIGPLANMAGENEGYRENAEMFDFARESCSQLCGK